MVNEVAALLRCTPALIYRLVASKTIPHLRVGRYIRFHPDILERWIKEQSHL